jgi:PKD domain-containing protein/galactose oxidase-like protein
MNPRGRSPVGRAVRCSILFLIAGLLALPGLTVGASPKVAAPLGAAWLGAAPIAPVTRCATPECARPSVATPGLSAPVWYNVTPFQRFSPPPLVGASLAYDALNNYLVLFGGCSSSSCPAPAQTWTYSGGEWTNVTALGPQPPARAFAAMAYDSHDSYVLLFGGRGAGGVALNDSWSFANGVWTNVTNNSDAPSARFAASMIFDNFDSYLVLFGGCGATGSPRNDTWRFSGGTWHNVTVSAGPPPPARYGGSFAGDAGDGYGLLFGGVGTTGPLNDSWEWEKGRWTRLTTVGTPPARSFAALTYNVVENMTFLVGGNGSAGPLNDVWRFSNGHWLNITGVGGAGPSERLGMAAPESTVATASTGERKWLYSFFYGGGLNPCVTCSNRSLGDSWVFEPGLALTASALPTVVEVGQPVDFTSTVAGGSGPYVYLWEFGDGASIFSQTPVHVYAWANGFSAGVIVSDTSGAEIDATVLVTVVSGPAVSVSIQPSATDVGRPVSFVGIAIGGTSPYSYRWSFGDQTGAGTADAQHEYSASGRFTVNLSVTDTVQGTGVSFGNVTINALPQITASASNRSPIVGTNVSFNATVAGGTGPFAFSWDFGDGNSSDAAAGVHDYTVPGTYAVSASVADSVGAVSWENFSIVAAGRSPPPVHPMNRSRGLTTTELFGAVLLGVGAVLAVVVAAVLLLHRRRREPPSLAAAAVGSPGWDDEDPASPSNSRAARRSLNRFYRRRS